MNNKPNYTNLVYVALKRPRLQAMMIFICVALILLTALEYAIPNIFGRVRVLQDFDAFYITGTMFWEGRIEEAYFAKTLFQAQKQILGTQNFLPWTYPPHFNIVASGLALMPIWLSYMLFTSASLIFYIYMLRRISPNHFMVALIFIAPAVTICIRNGQNGFLIAGLMASFLSGLKYKNFFGIISLIFLSMKPHFLPVAYLLGLLRGGWQTPLAALAGTALVLIISTMIFGYEIWPAFKNSIYEASLFLREGLYPLFRMTSFYSALFTLGVPPNIALIGQIAIAILAITVVIFAKLRNWPDNHLLSTGAMASLFISPYAYDYDLQILGVSLSFLMPELFAKATTKQMLLLMAACWLTPISIIFNLASDEMRFALNFWVLWPVCVSCLLIIRRQVKQK